MSATLTLPRMNGSMLPDDALALIADLIRDHRPELILEAGSGRSTVVLADLLRELGAGWLVSLEHLPEYAQQTKQWLAANALDEFAEVRYAPVRPQLVEGAHSEWYDPSGWDDLENIGLLLVDGPPANLSAFARNPALPLLRDRLASHAVIVLDDVFGRRREEAAIRNHWAELVPGLHWTTVPHSGGGLCYAVMP